MSKLQRIFKSAYKHYKNRKNERTQIQESENNVHILSSYFTYDCIVEDANIEQLILFNYPDGLQNWCWDKIIRVFTAMYPDPVHMMSPVDSVLIHIRNFKGVAHTVDGSRRGSKIIHISSDYISSIPTERRMKELDGVACHEMVHVFQYDGGHTVPHGLIEGIADFYRMRIGLGAQHWKPTIADKWDAGYEKTAYFLNWVDSQFPGAINQINLHFKNNKWFDEDPFERYTGQTVNTLYQRYTSAHEGTHS